MRSRCMSSDCNTTWFFVMPVITALACSVVGLSLFQHHVSMPSQVAASRVPPAPVKEVKNAKADASVEESAAPEPLIHLPRIRTRLPANGVPVNVNVRSGRSNSWGDETISISIKSSNDRVTGNDDKPFDWLAIVEVPGGGLVERTDAFASEAPVDGYAAKRGVNMPAWLPKEKWHSEIKRDYFVRFRSGNHALLRMKFSGKESRTVTEVFLNPKPGSRNLAFDPNKVVLAE